MIGASSFEWACVNGVVPRDPQPRQWRRDGDESEGYPDQESYPAVAGVAAAPLDDRCDDVAPTNSASMNPASDSEHPDDLCPRRAVVEFSGPKRKRDALGAEGP